MSTDKTITTTICGTVGLFAIARVLLDRPDLFDHAPMAGDTKFVLVDFANGREANREVFDRF